MARDRPFMSDYNFFNDPSWMDFKDPLETVAPARIVQLDPVAVPFPMIEDSPMYAPGAPVMSSAGRPLLPHGYRRGNSDDTYHQQSSSRYSSYQSPPRGYQNSRYAQNTQSGYSHNPYRYEHPSRSWSGAKRRTPPRNISHLSHNIAKHKQYCKENHSNKIGSEHDDSNKINKESPAEESPLGVDIKDLVTNLSFINQQNVFEKNDGKIFNTKSINNNNESDKTGIAYITDCYEETRLIETIPLLLDNSRKTTTAVTSTPTLPENTNSDTTEVPMELESPSFIHARSAVPETTDTSQTHYYDAIENPAKTGNTISIDAPELNLEVNSLDTIVSLNVKSKIEIKMDILLSPPKIVFNPNCLQVQGVDEAPFEDQCSEIIDLTDDSDDDEDVDHPKQSDSVLNKAVDFKDIGTSNLTENDNKEKKEPSESLKRKQRTLSCDDSASWKYKKLDSTEGKAHREGQLQSKCCTKNVQKQNSSSKQSQYEMKTDVANGKSKIVMSEGHVIKKQQKSSANAESKTKEKPNEKLKKHDVSVKRAMGGDKTKSINNKEKVQSNSKKHKSGNKKLASSEESTSAVVEKIKDSSAKDHAKRRQSCDETLGKHKTYNIIGRRRKSCFDKQSTAQTDVRKNSEIPAEDSSEIIDATSLNNDSSKPDTQTSMENLRENGNLSNTKSCDPVINGYDNIDVISKSAMLEKQITSTDFDGTLMCDNEIDQISSRVAKIRNRRHETDGSDLKHMRSKSVDMLREDLASFERSTPAKITKRRRTIFDASELIPNEGERSKPSRRPDSRNRNKYSDDPTFTANVQRSSTPCRITRSKSKEMMARACMDSTDAVVPKFPDDPDFYERTTPPATPRTPRHGETPEILRNLNVVSSGLIVTSGDSSLSFNEESQVMNHVYAPSFGPCDPRMSPLFIDKQQECDDTMVDKITLHNTMVNKISPPADSSQSAHVVLNMLTDDDIRSLKNDMANITKEETSKDDVRKPDIIFPSIPLYSNQDKNKIACSISIATIALPDLMGTGKASNNINVDIEQILKEMDAAPRPTKEPTPKVRKLIDPRNSSLTIDNTITVPLSNKHHLQTSAPKQFNPYTTTVSSDNDQSPHALPTKHDKSSKEQLKRLFDAEAKQMYILKHSGNDKQPLINKNRVSLNATIPKKSKKKDPKQEALKKNNTSNKVQQKSNKTVTKSIPIPRHHTYETIVPFVEEDTVPMLDLPHGVDVSQATTLIQSVTNLDLANVRPLVIGSTTETIKSIVEISEDDILNLDEIFDNDVGNLSINGELPEGFRSNVKGETAATSSSVIRRYDNPTLVATIDLDAKLDEDDCEIKPAVPVDISIPSPQSSSILIVSVMEYVMNVTSVIGQYVQMEKLHLRTQDLVKKCTTSFALETIDCDDIVQEFKKLYTAKLGMKFIDYTDLIEIQNFSVTILYTTLTEASLQYNGIKIKKYDVAKTICDFYNAVGNQHLRSVFCKQLYQLSAHMKEIEFTADNERNKHQQHPSLNQSPITTDNNPVSTDTRQSDSQCTLNLSPLNSSTSPSINSTISDQIAANPASNPAIENISPPPIIFSSTIATASEVLVSIGHSTPEIGAVSPITTVHYTSPTVHIPRIPDSIATPAIQRTSESLLLSSGVSVTQHPESPQIFAHNQQLGTVVLPSSIAAQNVVLINQQPFVASVTSAHVPDLSHTIVLNQGQQSTLPVKSQTNTPNKRRIKHTAPIHSLAELFSASSESVQRLYDQIAMYNLLVKNYRAPTKINTPAVSNGNYKQSRTTTNASNTSRVAIASTFVPSSSSSNNFAKPSRTAHNCNTAASTPQGLDLRKLRNYRPDLAIRSNKNAPRNKPDASANLIQSAADPNPIEGAVVNNPIPISSVCPLPESNVRISVRNLNHLQQSSPGEMQKAKSNKPKNKRNVSGKEQLVIAGISSSPTIHIGNKNVPSARTQSLNEIQLMVAQIDDAATHSCIAEANNAKKQQRGVSARVRSFSNGDASSPQTQQDPIVRNLSRDSGNSSVDAYEEPQDLIDISCICGQTADKICSCKLIVYCSEICQRKDWIRHSADHVEI